MDMADHLSVLSQRWTDILPPLPPAPVSSWLLLSSVALALLVVGVVWVLWQQRPRQRALRMLQRCRRQLITMQIDSRQIAYAIHCAMLQGLGLNPATVVTNVQQTDPHWQAFYRQLQCCVFQAATPSADELADLIQQGRYWLRHFPR
jgi:hypothetical protein